MGCISLDVKKFLHELFGWNCSIETSILNDKIKYLESQNKELSSFYNNELYNLNTLIINLKEQISKLKEETPLNKHNFRKYTFNYYTIDGLKIHPSAFLTITDPSIKSLALRLKKDTILETAQAVKDWIHKNIKYVHDEQNTWLRKKEYFQPSYMTLATKTGDCEDMTMLFYSLMYHCGYGQDTVCAIGKVKWYNGDIIGHAYNYVYYDGKWYLYDSNAGDRQDDIEYPNDEYVIYNSEGSWKWR